jgi:DmsE family decaheme c-type cytochrome
MREIFPDARKYPPIHRNVVLLCAGLWVLAALSVATPLLAANTVKQAVASASAPAKSMSAAAGYVGEKTCLMCHTDIAKSFPNNPHSQLAMEHAGHGVTCEACHGPGKAHVESGGDPTKIFRFEKASAQQVDNKCLTCHAAAHPNFLRSAHGQAGVSCLSCHSVHHAKTASFLLVAAQPQLCYRCHADIRVRFSLPFHHPVTEGLMKCTDCHDPHGTFGHDQLRSTADLNLICTKCHAETAGPFVYEHPVVRTEGCLSCHDPHGSPNPRLLKVSNVNTLCLRCHTASMTFDAPGTPSFHNQNAQYVSCTSCHTQIHGSNTSDVFFK